ncbi:Cytochrome P450 [Canna indica]|uniref:Cytochrome P450 n=1 Tax=Canna indica TaxID=4628 RepID=A0AAQ3JR11_9LILI|nr:Cytochrome P450 [Canna indica]
MHLPRQRACGHCQLARAWSRVLEEARCQFCLEAPHHGYGVRRVWLPHSDLQPLGDQWKKMRRVVASEVLSANRLQRESILRAEEADHFTRYLYNLCAAGYAIDVRLALRYYRGNIIRRMVFGVRHFGEGGEFGGPSEEELDHAMGLIYKYHDAIINKRLEKWRRCRENGGDDGEKKDVEDVLDVFLFLRDASEKPLLSIEEIRAQSRTYFGWHYWFDIPSFKDKVLECWMFGVVIGERSTIDRWVGKTRLLRDRLREKQKELDFGPSSSAINRKESRSNGFCLPKLFSGFYRLDLSTEDVSSMASSVLEARPRLPLPYWPIV